MATLFIDIYKENEIIRNDNRLKFKPTNKIYELYYLYLKSGIALFSRCCYKNLANNIPFSQTEYLFKSNGIDNEYLLESPNIPPENCNFYVGYTTDINTSYVEINENEYSYNKTTHILTINSTDKIIIENDYIYVSAYIIGQFNDTLDYDEVNILVNAMNIPFLQEQENRNSLLNQIVYGGGQKIYSQGEHINSVHKVLKDQKDSVNVMIKEYTYCANPNRLCGLGGGN